MEKMSPSEAGRLGGKKITENTKRKGTASMTPEQRSENARKAARKRWNKENHEETEVEQ